MGEENLFSIFKKAFVDFYKNLVIVMPSLFLFVFFVIFSEISIEVNRKLNSNASLTAWLVFFSFISLYAMGFFLSGLIGMCFEAASKRKAKIVDFWKYSKKFWFSNFVIIFIIIIFYNLIRYIAHNAAFLIGMSLNLSTEIASGIFFLLYFAGLAGVIIFLTFSNFYLIIKNKGIFWSLRGSTLLVKKRYIYTLLIILIFFVINEVLNYLLKGLINELANVLIVPYLALILARFVLEFDKNVA